MTHFQAGAVDLRVELDSVGDVARQLLQLVILLALEGVFFGRL
jgi:hypothetical protein